jgi:LacI family transcriptional regulator
MDRKKKVSLGSIAKVAEVSTSAVSLALQNRPGVSPAMREKILRIARELGYAPNARLSMVMAEVRKTESKDLLPIAWLNTGWERDAWQRYLFQSPYLNGARARALELGYKVDEIWAHEPGMTMKRLTKILYQRGIEGVVVTHPARHLRLDWDHLASVSLGASLLAPRLHRVVADLNFNLLLALKSLRRLGYRRIGICLAQEVDSASHYTLRATARDLYFSASPEERIPPLFHAPFAYYPAKDNIGGKKSRINNEPTSEAPVVILGNVGVPRQWQQTITENQDKKRSEVVKWLKRYKPEVIVGHDSFLKPWAEAAGYRVPEDIGIVHLAIDDDVLDWAGIHSRRRETGATAIEWLVSLMRNHQYGVPATPLNILIRGTWQTGKTLIAKKAKS